MGCACGCSTTAQIFIFVEDFAPLMLRCGNRIARMRLAIAKCMPSCVFACLHVCPWACLHVRKPTCKTARPFT